LGLHYGTQKTIWGQKSAGRKLHPKVPTNAHLVSA
jgi:hypothetical protein